MKTASVAKVAASDRTTAPKWLPGAYTALLVATMLAPSESAAQRGTHAALCLGWFLLFLVHAVLVTGGRITMPQYAGRSRQPAAWWARDEWLLPVFAMGLSGSCWWRLNSGDARGALNIYWQWLAWMCAYLLCRWTIRTATEIRLVMLVILAVVVGQACYGGYQRWFMFPAFEHAYHRHPDMVLSAQGIPSEPGNAARAAFEERLKERAPTGAFLHPNSLAGLLAVACTMFTGIALSTLRGQQLPRLRRAGIILGAIVFTVISFACVLATASRGGLIASLLGMYLVMAWPQPKSPSARRSVTGWHGWAPAYGALAGGVAAAMFIGSPWGESARRSLTVRRDYWLASINMILDAPLWGCGLGNFQDCYTAYRPAWASEVFADPHNAWLEVAATAGLPAAIALAAFQFIGMARVVIRQRASAARCVGTDSNFGIGDSSTDAGFAGALFGIPLVCLTAGFVLRIPPPMLFVVGVPAAVLCAWGLRTWMAEGALPAHHLIAATLALLSNLAISGGIAYGGVAIVLWTLMALARNASLAVPAASFSELARESFATRRWRQTGGLGILLGTVLLAAAHHTMFAPIHRSQTLLAQAALANELGDLTASARACREAAIADRWSAVAARRWCEAAWKSWEVTGDEATRMELERAIATAIERSPRSAALRGWLGNHFLASFRRSTSLGRAELLERAVDEYGEVVRLYPRSALAWGQLAYAESMRGQATRSARAFDRAIQLDEKQPMNPEKLASHPLFDDPPLREPALVTLRRMSRDKALEQATSSTVQDLGRSR